MSDFASLWEIASGRPAPRPSPAERLTAAIEALEILKARSTPGPWAKVQHPDPEIAVEYVRGAIEGGLEVAVAYATNLHPADVALIVALHRTIDAQLEILRRGNLTAVEGSLAVMLADAFLGGVS